MSTLTLRIPYKIYVDLVIEVDTDDFDDTDSNEEILEAVEQDLTVVEYAQGVSPSLGVDTMTKMASVDYEYTSGDTAGESTID